jgi:hypothetical protein
MRPPQFEVKNEESDFAGAEGISANLAKRNQHEVSERRPCLYVHRPATIAWNRLKIFRDATELRLTARALSR